MPRLDLIRPLAEAENEFVQVLIDRFELRRVGQGCELSLSFNDRTDAIWLRESKRVLRAALDDSSIAACQKRIDAVLLHGTKPTYSHKRGGIRFRWGNGGTLPLIRRGKRDYYCLFYRDEHPVGWNLANGGSNNLHELLHPEEVIERELREELLIVNPERKFRYVFRWDAGRSPEHPDFAIARRVWDTLIEGDAAFSSLDQVPLPLTWLRAPDTVHVKYGNRRYTLRNCYLNVNSEDFGIEVDRFARLSVAPETIFCDGELTRGDLQNRVVGLFEVDRFHERLAVDSEEFAPDVFFLSGQDRSSDGIGQVVSEAVHYSKTHGLGNGVAWKAAHRKGVDLNLCPVTRNLTTRSHTRWTKERVDTNNCDVFLSFGSEDRELAKKVEGLLIDEGFRVFFSDKSHRTNFQRAINDALTLAHAFVAVGTQLEHLTKPWVLYECDAFNGFVLSGTKPPDSPMVTLTTVARDRLPLPLCARTAIPLRDPANPEPDVHVLKSYLRGSSVAFV